MLSYFGTFIPHIGDAMEISSPLVNTLRGSVMDSYSKHPLATALRARFDLSLAEAQIALAIANGAGLRDIAVVRGASIQTVRSQLKAIFRKTGATSQARLVALVLR